jgi:hypothetical protein
MGSTHKRVALSISTRLALSASICQSGSVRIAAPPGSIKSRSLDWLAIDRLGFYFDGEESVTHRGKYLKRSEVLLKPTA